MDELIETLTSKVGIDKTVSEKSASLILGFLRKEGISSHVETLIAAIPGAESSIAANAAGGGLSSLMGGGLMALGTKLMALGLGLEQIQSIARELLSFGRDRIGADRMGDILDATPSLRQFV